MVHIFRSNRAQFGNVFLRSMSNNEASYIRLPTASGIAEEDDSDEEEDGLFIDIEQY